MLLRIALAFGALLFGSTQAFAAWHEAKSKHFIIYANADPRLLNDFAVRLEKFDQGVRRVRGMDDPPLGDAGKATIYVVGDLDDVEKLIGVQGAAGMYIGRASGAVAFVPKLTRNKGEPWELNSQAIFFHEYMHHLQLENTTAVLPRWLVEGTAEFFSTARFEKDGSMGIGAAAGHRALGLYLLDSIPLEDLVGDSFDKLNNERFETLYGRSWLLTHYLNFEPGRRGQIDTYVRLIQEGQQPLAAAQAAFGDMKELDRELRRYMKRKRLGYLLVPASELNAGPIAIRPLRSSEAAIMRVRIRSDRGVSSKSAPTVAAEARKIAERFPNDPVVQGALAEAEFDADDFVAAEAAADRALAADPNSRQVLIYKGRAQMEQARANPAKADWAQVRSWFMKANRLDPDDPEPLVRFYQTFAAAGETPTANAVQGLIYAAQLVPQDKGLRVLATRQLLVDEKAALARQMFAAIAYNAHSVTKVREKNRSIMDAIVRGDSKGALALLDADEEEEDTQSDRGRR